MNHNSIINFRITLHLFIGFRNFLVSHKRSRIIYRWVCLSWLRNFS
ncbi:MAG TPA: hypothetical protein [Caudoviricetes sp.]|nr:MAG TPA: hypothetical protein [Caudoviricetes sp.]